MDSHYLYLLSGKNSSYVDPQCGEQKLQGLCLKIEENADLVPIHKFQYLQQILTLSALKLLFNLIWVDNCQLIILGFGNR